MDGTAGLDLHTLGVIDLAVGLATALSFTLLSLALRGMLAMRVWTVAFWILALAGLAQAYDESGAFLPAMVGSTLLALANGAMLIGIAIHVGFPLRWRWPLLLIAAFTAVQVGFFVSPPPQGVETVAFGVKSVIWDVWMICLLIGRGPRELRTSAAFTATVLMVDVLFYLSRVLVSLNPEIDPHALPITMLNTSNYLFGILCTFLLSTGFTLMLVQRLVHDLRHAAEVDGLTGLLNRSALVRESSRRLAAARGHSHAALLFDLDNFKAVNDRWGHAGGDAVLVHFAETLRTGGLPEHALFSRYGGEEFLVLVPSTSADMAATLAERLRTRVESEPVAFAGDEITFTTSVGVCASMETDIHVLVEAADEALYRAKHAGRNRVELA